MTHPVETSSGTGTPTNPYVRSSPKRLRGQSRDEHIFYEEFIRVLDASDVDEAVKHEVSNEYVSDRPAFAARLLAKTNVPRATVRSPWRTFAHVMRGILVVSGLIVLIALTRNAIVGVLHRDFEVVTLISIAISFPAWIWLIRRLITRRLSFWPTAPRLNDLQDAEAQYRDVVRVQISDYLNRVVNKLLEESLAAEEEARRRAAEESAEVVLSTTDAPRLVELENQDPVRVKALRDLQEFIRSHVTSAIGISGPRAIGKTTIMRQLCARYQDHYVGVYVPGETTI